MKLKAIVDALDLRVAAGGERLDMEVTGGYTSDLLSCAMAGAEQGQCLGDAAGSPERGRSGEPE